MVVCNPQAWAEGCIAIADLLTALSWVEPSVGAGAGHHTQAVGAAQA